MKKLLLGLTLLSSISAFAKVNCGSYIKGQDLLESTEDVSSVDLNSNTELMQAFRAKWHQIGYIRGVVTGVGLVMPDSVLAKILSDDKARINLYLITNDICRANPTAEFNQALIGAINYMVKQATQQQDQPQQDDQSQDQSQQDQPQQDQADQVSETTEANEVL